MAELNTEPLLTPFEAAVSLPTVSGRPVYATTLLHRCHKGMKGLSLEHRRNGRRICTSLGAHDYFLKALEAKDTASASDARHA